MKKLLIFIPLLTLVACSSEEYDCHIITKNHTFTETKLCDGQCSPMFKITDVKEQITDRHEIVKKSNLKNFIRAEYDSADMVNAIHPDFVSQIGYNPIQIIELDCKKL